MNRLDEKEELNGGKYAGRLQGILLSGLDLVLSANFLALFLVQIKINC